MAEKFYLTTPLYYVNSKPHIGHSYTNIAADTLARFWRLSGKEVLFLTGTDEHGQKVDKAAKEAGLSPKEFTDQISGTFRDLWKTLHIQYDDFIRTTEPRHVQAVQEVWKKLDQKGDIYQDSYTGWYCTPCETFWLESQVLHENGQNLCPDCKRALEHLEEKNYFLKLGKYQPWLIETIRRGDELQIRPTTRKNEVLGFLENNALQDLCISRPKSRLSWGIVSPLSPDHVTYVWFDALINYIAACGYGADEKKLRKWWPADVHIIGKDILRHHAVYWTILLKALDLPLPKMIFAHGWWLQGGDKMSKSKGNVTDPAALVEKYGVDAYRYFLLSETPFGEDGTFTEEALIKRFNFDLANDLGNLVSRSLSMCEKYCAGQIPTDVKWDGPANEFKVLCEALPDKITRHLLKLEFDQALAEIWTLINKANKYIEDRAPWKLAKEGKSDEVQLVMRVLIEVLGSVSTVLWPFMPTTAGLIRKQLGSTSDISQGTISKYAWGNFENGGSIAKTGPLFPRIDTDKSGQV